MGRVRRRGWLFFFLFVSIVSRRFRLQPCERRPGKPNCVTETHPQRIGATVTNPVADIFATDAAIYGVTPWRQGQQNFPVHDRLPSPSRKSPTVRCSIGPNGSGVGAWSTIRRVTCPTRRDNVLAQKSRERTCSRPIARHRSQRLAAERPPSEPGTAGVAFQEGFQPVEAVEQHSRRCAKTLQRLAS